MPNPNKNSAAKKAPSTSTITKKYSKSTPCPKILGGNIVDSYQTKVEEIIVHVFTRLDKPFASFVSPMKKTCEADPGLASSWNIREWFSRRNTTKLDENITMTSPPNTDYLWDVAVTYKWLLEEDVDARAIGKNLAEVFSEFSKNSDEIRGSQPYTFHKATTANPKPLNYYLLDEDVVKIMRMVYEGTDKGLLMEDDGILGDFFGSTEQGRAFLAGMADEAWDNLINVDTNDEQE
jgi:hypothetical protein